MKPKYRGSGIPKFISGHSSRGRPAHSLNKTKENYIPLRVVSEKLKEAHQKKKWGFELLPNHNKDKTKENYEPLARASIAKSAKHQGIDIKDWTHFISQGEDYGKGFNEQFKELIRERENRCCVICNEMEENLNVKLSVHHIDYNKKNSILQNCVALCRGCHAKTNTNRKQWKPFFQSLLTERYGYEYTEDGKVIINLEATNEC